jgi:hypothetical protein
MTENTTVPHDALPTSQKDSAAYMSLFPDASTRCAPGALQANTSHAAYLVYLKGLIETLEVRADVASPITLRTRRPDLLRLELDDHNAKKAIPNLRLVLGLLESRAREAVPEGQTLQQAVASTVYKGSLPFDTAWEAFKAALMFKQLPLLDVLRASDVHHPSFVLDYLTHADQRAAIALSSGFAPQLRTLLLANQSAGSSLSGLTTTQAVSKALGLTRKELRRLLAVSAVGDSATSVVLSRHVSAADYYSGSGELYGAQYLNDFKTPLYLTQPDANVTTVDISGITDEHLGRLQRIVLIQRALALEPEEADLLLAEALWAEHEGDEHPITAATLRALGLFRHLQLNHGVGAHQYAAFLSEISVYGTHRHRPFYDQLFAPASTEEPSGQGSVLQLDGGEFDPKASDGPDALTVKQLCLAFKVDETVLRAALEWVVDAQGLSRPARSLEVVSACYRLTALPRLFGVKPKEGMLLLALLNQHDSTYKTQLAGIPTLGGDQAQADIVDVIVGVMDTMRWFKSQHWGADQLYLMLQSEVSVFRPHWESVCLDVQLDADLEQLQGCIQTALQLDDLAKVAPLLKWAGLDNQSFYDNLRAIQRKRADDQLAPQACFSDQDINDWARLDRYSTFVKSVELSTGMLKQLVDDPAWFDLLADSQAGLRDLDLSTVYLLGRYKALLAKLPADKNESDVIQYLADANTTEDGTPPADKAATAWTVLESLLGEPKASLAQLTALAPPTTLGQIDRLLRLLELAQQHSLSVTALVEIGQLPATTAAVSFEQVSTALRQSCTATQRKRLDEQLSVAWRDALVNFMLAEWAPGDAQRSGVTSVQALTDYLLIDVKVSHEPRTTRVVSAIASLQRYLHQVYSRQENGYRHTLLQEAEREEWNEFASRYEHWKLRQQVRNEPQNFIDPTRRTRKTSVFTELENLLAQGKCQPQDIQTAMVGYLSTFEKLSNIQPISAYADGTSPLQDTYHFIGKTNVEPIEYYWRTLDLRQRDQDGAPSMLAWGEWEKITLGLSGVLARTQLSTTSPLQYIAGNPQTDAETAAEQTKREAAEALKATEDTLLAQDERTHIELVRPVIIAGRRYVVWAEWETTAIALGANNRASEYYPLRVCFSFQQTDGAWSAPNELLRLDGHDENGQFDTSATLKSPVGGSTSSNAFLKTKAYQPGLAVMLNNMGDRVNDPWLTVLLFDSAKADIPSIEDVPNWKNKHAYFIVSKDLLLLEHKTLDAVSTAKKPIESRLVSNWLRFFRDPRVVQHPYVGALMTLEATETTHIEWKGLTETQAKDYAIRTTPAFSFETLVNAGQSDVKIWLNSNLEIERIKQYYIIERPMRGPVATCSVEQIKGARSHFGNTYEEYDVFFKITFLGSHLQDVESIQLPYQPGMPINNPSKGETLKYTATRFVKFGRDHDSPRAEVVVAEVVKNVLLELGCFYAHTRNTRETLTLPLRPHFHMNDVSVSLSIETADTNSPTWTLSTSEQALLNDFKLAKIKAFATDSPAEFSNFKKDLLKNRSITETALNSILDLPAPQNATGAFAIEDAVNKAGTLNRADAINALIAQEVEALKSSGAALPEEISLESAVRLRHLHPAACRKILLYIDPAHTMQYESTLSVKGDGRVLFRCPLPKDLPNYTFKATVHDTDNNELGSASQAFEWKEQPDDVVPSVHIRRNLAQVLYIDFAEANRKLADASVSHIRLNTLFGKQLVALATQSVERALSWEAQCLPEPALASTDEHSTVDFRSANGMYFWELFFHVPFLVAWQLRQNREYRAAWRWCTRHLFDPYRTWAPEGNHAPLYWMSQPLNAATGFDASPAENDPDLLAYATPERYRKALHLFVAESWQRQGDDLYRQLTRDTLIEAALCYDNALRLIGPLPEHFSSAPVKASTLADARPKDFVPPLNDKLVALRDLLRNRLFNLRHGLTLDGKPAPVLLETQTYNPAGLGYGGHGLAQGGGLKIARPVPPCRYSEVRKSADAAVLQLIELGQTLTRFYEAEGQQKLALVSKANVVKLLDFPCRLQEQALEAAKRGRDTLLASKRMIQHRLGYYQGLVDEGVTDLEHASQAMAYTSQVAKGISIVYVASSGILEATVPTIYGMAFGGNRPGKGVATNATLLDIASELAIMAKDELRLQADYQLRAQQWQFEADQANLEVQVVDGQLLEQDIHMRAAKIAVAEARAMQAAHQAEYQVITSVFASHPTYLWLIGRLSDIYSTAYDATLSLCLMAEASLQYELGDFRTTWIRTDGWLDNWRGMLAGEALERDLIQMDVAAISNNERTLDIRLDLSLCKCMGWNAATLQKRIKDGEVPFDLTARHFDEQYPGHYLRRVERIVLTFKAGDKTLSGSVAAMLTQTRNLVLLSNDSAGAQRLYLASEGSEDNLLRDLRPNQQAAVWYTKELSRNFDLQPGPKDETRYQPFEGTGAISSWVLSFPGGAQANAVLFKGDECLVTDIVIQMAYSAMDGGEAFSAQVKGIMDSDTSNSPAGSEPQGQHGNDADAKGRAEAQAAAEAKRKAEAEAAAEAKRKAEAEAAAQAKRKAEAEAAAEAKRKAEAEAAAQAKRKAEAEKNAAAQKRKAISTAAVNKARQAEKQALEALARAEQDAGRSVFKESHVAIEAQKALDAIARARAACAQATAARKRAEQADTAGQADRTVVACDETVQAAKDVATAAQEIADALDSAERAKSPAAIYALAKKFMGQQVRVEKKDGTVEVGTLSSHGSIGNLWVSVSRHFSGSNTSVTTIYMEHLANITKA